jgi:predicted dithiol-disulfide oxidoreductase (DUF899 family)
MDQPTSVAGSLHGERFPNETAAYRAARDELLLAERDLRRQVEAVAELRRALPLGGEVPEDSVFEGEDGPVRLSELFGGKDTLAAYSFMYGPRMEQACPSCTSMLDGLDGQAPHITQRIALAVIARSPIARIRAHADARGWRRLRLLSSANNSYGRDYHGESEDGRQLPMLNVFARRDGRVFHTWASELAFAPREPGQDPRHIDMIWPLWNMLDFTPEGRGADWRPSLSYDA